MTNIEWQIAREGRAWRKEALSRYQLTPEKIEMVDGRLFNNDEERLTMLALLIENMGTDAVVQLGSPDVWREAVRALD